MSAPTRSRHNGLEHDAIALVLQIRAIDRARLEKKVGILEKMMLQKIEHELKKLLAL